MAASSSVATPRENLLMATGPLETRPGFANRIFGGRGAPEEPVPVDCPAIMFDPRRVVRVESRLRTCYTYTSRQQRFYVIVCKCTWTVD